MYTYYIIIPVVIRTPLQTAVTLESLVRG